MTVRTGTASPRSRSLASALTAPAPADVTAADLERLRVRLGHDLARAVGPNAGGGGGRRPPVRVDGYTIGSAARGAVIRSPEPFRWSPWHARHAIGVAAARDCVLGPFPSPGPAVRATITRLLAESRGGGGERSLRGWLAGLRPGALAMVAAEATTWATHLVTAVDWDAIGPRVTIGPPDRWWDCPTVPRIALRGRADVRVTTATPLPDRTAGRRSAASPPGAGPSAVLTVLGGRPGPASRAELGLVALVDALRQPSGAVPSRIVGWWPECGRRLIVDVDGPLLDMTAAAVTGAVRALIDPVVGRAA
jgi:hypothetical protein